MVSALGIILGFFSGMAVLFIWGVWAVRRSLRNLDDAKARRQKELEKYEAVRPRLKQAADISNLQMELLAQTQMPSKNSLHSKHKNDLVYEIRELEEKKLGILRSIIQEGFDPDISLSTPEGGKEVIKLSEYMQRGSASVAVPPSNPDARPTKNSKFFVIDGGKGDTTH